MGQLSGTVLVARHGKVLLDRGYGYADLATHRPNDANTEYGLANATTTALLTADALQGTQAVSGIDPANGLGSTHLTESICDQSAVSNMIFGTSTNLLAKGTCPAKWKGITLDDLIDGTSGLPSYHVGQSGRNDLQTQALCESHPLGRRRAAVDYSSCNNLILGLAAPTIYKPNQGSLSEVWLPTGIIPGGSGPIAFTGNHSDFLAHELYDGPQQPPQLAVDYTAGGKHLAGSYDDYYAAYTSARDLYTYDRLLFSGRLMSPANTRRLISARGIAAPPDPGIGNAQWAEGWKVGELFGQKVIYTAGNLNDYETANLWFPKLDTAVVVLANRASTDALNVAEHSAAFVMDGSEADAAATKAPSVSDLPGTYIQRWTWPNFHYILEQGDHAPAVLLGLPSSVTAQQSSTPQHGTGAYGVHNLELRITRRLFILAAKQPYTANNLGRLSLFGPPPGSPGLHGCTPFNTDIMWSGYYHWSLLGRQLSITKVRDTCNDRVHLISGTWTRVSGPTH